MKELNSFLIALNSFHETIKFTADISENSVNFLDVKVTKDSTGNMITDCTLNRHTPTFIFTITLFTLNIKNKVYLTAKRYKFTEYAVLNIDNEPQDLQITTIYRIFDIAKDLIKISNNILIHISFIRTLKYLPSVYTTTSTFTLTLINYF